MKKLMPTVPGLLLRVFATLALALPLTARGADREDRRADRNRLPAAATHGARDAARSARSRRTTPPPFVLKSYLLLPVHAEPVVWSTVKHAEGNRPLHRAFWAVFREATDLLNAQKKRAAQMYLQASGHKESTVADIREILKDPEVRFSITAQRWMPVADFMSKVAAIKRKASNCKEFYFPKVHNLSGN